MNCSADPRVRTGLLGATVTDTRVGGGGGGGDDEDDPPQLQKTSKQKTTRDVVRKWRTATILYVYDIGPPDRSFLISANKDRLARPAIA